MSRAEQTAKRDQILAQPELRTLLDRFEAELHAGSHPRIEDFLATSSPQRLILLEELVHIEIEYRSKQGQTVWSADYLNRFPELASNADCASRLRETCERLLATAIPPASPDHKPVRREPVPQVPPTDDPDLLPESIGRYGIVRLLGKGGFGVVYLAHDQQLMRHVAVKVPHGELVSHLGDAQAYLAEARTVASLDHPHIVPVHDVGSTPQFPLYVVSKYVDGGDLAAALAQSRKSCRETAELVATIAEAVHYAHKQGLFHRDLKPGNILLDKAGRPYVVDFGLALRERDVGKGSGFVGTPAYMSPEQARGEGHRIDGRSDIFSLGVILYEMLLGRRPFRAQARNELLEQIATREAQPPRQIDDSVPRELERICLKALAKRAADRYTAAGDLAEDLRAWLATAPPSETAKPATAASATAAATLVPATTPATAPKSDSRPLKIIPKGLRSFDEHDADFFLELLPGPRDRDGLPDSVRFWKARIEEPDPDQTFAVGLIYGPSGCGKSSLVKAGLLPRLANSVAAIYVEATGEETEARLLKALRRRAPDLPPNLGLTESLAALRQGQFLAPSQKVLIVLDQFEQWLHAKPLESIPLPTAETARGEGQLVNALRHCDGGRLQAIVMVRDDFWLAVSRFMQELEVRILEGENSRLVDLFDPDHARRVLGAFGRAFGKLPENSGALDQGQKEFLEQALAGLAENGKLISVRLALFSEMMKDKAWTPASLKAVGGTQGVGVSFLEETFSAAGAPPEHRYHQKAARAVLKLLLPETGTGIKGHMRSQQELLEASGCASHPRDFEDLFEFSTTKSA